MDAQATIWTSIKAANQAWLGGDARGVASLFHEDVVMFSPRGEVPVRGRDAMVKSYDAYHRRTRTLAFDEFDHLVNVFGDTARASYRFHIAYEPDGHKHEETGREVRTSTIGGTCSEIGRPCAADEFARRPLIEYTQVLESRPCPLSGGSGPHEC